MLEKKQLIDIIKQGIKDALPNIHTSTIAKISAINEKTINCKPVIARIFNGQIIQLPEFTEVPIINIQGGASNLLMPVSIGDYCLLHFMERCFDAWWNGQDFQPPAEYRVHDYSDAFALVGVKPYQTSYPIPDHIIQNGDTEQNGDYTHNGNKNQQGDKTQTGDYILAGNINQQGDKTQTGDYILNGDLIVNGNLNVSGNIVCQGIISASGFTGLNGGTMTSTVDIETTGEVKAGLVTLGGHRHGYNWTDNAGVGTTSVGVG